MKKLLRTYRISLYMDVLGIVSHFPSGPSAIKFAYTTTTTTTTLQANLAKRKRKRECVRERERRDPQKGVLVLFCHPCSSQTEYTAMQCQPGLLFAGEVQLLLLKVRKKLFLFPFLWDLACIKCLCTERNVSFCSLTCATPLKWIIQLHQQ